jgi:hypothetical protein
METDPISETLCFLVFTILDDGQSPEFLSLMNDELERILEEAAMAYSRYYPGIYWWGA